VSDKAEAKRSDKSDKGKKRDLERDKDRDGNIVTTSPPSKRFHSTEISCEKEEEKTFKR
jgi:hypothetical protein